jgi:dsDNA-binding SOS-regulon protein
MSTNFPTSADSFDRMSDLSTSTKSKIDQYYTYLEADNISGANAYLASNADLVPCLLNAAKINNLYDAVEAIEAYIIDLWQNYVFNVSQDKGTYSDTTQYTKFNVVK